MNAYIRSTLFVAIISLCFASVQTLIAGDEIGTVVAVQGHVVLHRNDGTETIAAIKTPVYLLDKVVTGDNAKIQIQFLDETILAQGSNSEMTIDEYVFAPEEEDVNALFSLSRGVFRTITGRITDINPRRFRVRTGLATIGIRGCDVGFNLRGNSHQIMALWLPPGHSLHIQHDNPPPGVPAPSPQRVRRAGRIVQVDPAGTMSQRPLEAQDAANLIQDTTPQIGDDDTDPADDTDTPPPMPGDDPDEDTPPMDPLDTGTDDDSAGQEDTTDPLSGNQLADTLSTGSLQQDDPFQQPDPPPPPPPEEDDEDEDTADTTDTPSTGNTYTVEDSGEGWNWGWWRDSSDTIVDSGYNITQPLSDSDVNELITDGSFYYLTGTGQAGALVTVNNALAGAPLLGDVTFTMEIGAGYYNSWNADFDLNRNDQDTLRFLMNGEFDGNKLVLLGMSNYSFNFNDEPYDGDDVNTRSIEGKLAGPGLSAPDPITGVAGKFSIKQHNGISIGGAFGADLSTNGY